MPLYNPVTKLELGVTQVCGINGNYEASRDTSFMCMCMSCGMCSGCFPRVNVQYQLSIRN